MFRYPHYNEPYLKQVRHSSLLPFHWKYEQSFTSFEFCIGTSKMVRYNGVMTVRVTDELTNALITMFLTDTLLAVLVRLALGVQRVDRATVAHSRHWTIAEHETVATVRPVLALIEFVGARKTLFSKKLMSNRLQIIVATIAISPNYTRSRTNVGTIPLIVLGIVPGGGQGK